MHKNITPQTLKSWIDSGNVVIIDVREPFEHMESKIDSANLIPLKEVSLSKIKLQKEKKLVLHCKSGRRSVDACKKLLSENPKLEIYNLEGGIESWANCGMPVIRSSGNNSFSLYRQLYLTVGSAVTLGSFLGYFYDSRFFALSGFFGLGLLFASATGSCTMLNILSSMPWNKNNK
jgi:rhodanese-related sulfurtransferase